jgi:hypothetical protein
MEVLVAVALSQSGVGWAHGVPSTQAPALLHVSGVVPLHPIAPGLHVTQEGEVVRHTGVAPVHVICVCHVPVLSHIWTALPLHRVAIEPGVHWSHVAEVEEVLWQTGFAPEHVVWFCQVPVLSHCRMMVRVLSHCVLPATQVPAHALPEQVELTQGVDVPHCPVLSQVW